MFLALIKHNYTLRQCKRLKKRETPCLYFHIGRCKAPCCGKISAKEYGKDIEEITLLLEGEMEDVSGTLKEKMKEAAEKKEFEKAEIFSLSSSFVRCIRILVSDIEVKKLINSIRI